MRALLLSAGALLVVAHAGGWPLLSRPPQAAADGAGRAALVLTVTVNKKTPRQAERTGVRTGHPVVKRYRLTNRSGADLHRVTLTDPSVPRGALRCPRGQGFWMRGMTSVLCTARFPAAPGRHAATARARGEIPSLGLRPTATARAGYQGVGGALALAVSVRDAVAPRTVVRYVISNPGNRTVHDPRLTDAGLGRPPLNCGGRPGPPRALAPGAVAVCEARPAGLRPGPHRAAPEVRGSDRLFTLGPTCTRPAPPPVLVARAVAPFVVAPPPPPPGAGGAVAGGAGGVGGTSVVGAAGTAAGAAGAAGGAAGAAGAAGGSGGAAGAAGAAAARAAAGVAGTAAGVAPVPAPGAPGAPAAPGTAAAGTPGAAVPPGALAPGAAGAAFLTPPAPFAPGAVAPPAVIPPGLAAPGLVPPGLVPGLTAPGAAPPGLTPPGAVPPGAVPPGAVPPGAVPPGGLAGLAGTAGAASAGVGPGSGTGSGARPPGEARPDGPRTPATAPDGGLTARADGGYRRDESLSPAVFLLLLFLPAAALVVLASRRL
ncbi:hypothetical protein [Streptomyces sp. NPDC015131]|uniref:hypothetical protein n=1 Tax=Streptomyces sp. NPDC015131 TaxID=3364941 RepID=UPI0036F89A05